MIKNKFFRGYVSSRAINGNLIPQSLQNLKIRDYANAKNLGFIHPTSKKFMNFDSKLPQDFKKILDLLNKLSH